MEIRSTSGVKSLSTCHDGVTQPLVVAEMTADEDQLRTKLAGPPAGHAADRLRKPWLHKRQQARPRHRRRWACRARTGRAIARPKRRTHRGRRGGWWLSFPSRPSPSQNPGNDRAKDQASWALPEASGHENIKRTNIDDCQAGPVPFAAGRRSSGPLGAGTASPRSLSPASEQPYSAATRCTRHCVISARSEAGLTGLLRICAPAARASSRTCSERSAVTRIAGRSRP